MTKGQRTVPYLRAILFKPSFTFFPEGVSGETSSFSFKTLLIPLTISLKSTSRLPAREVGTSSRVTTSSPGNSSVGFSAALSVFPSAGAEKVSPSSPPDGLTDAGSLPLAAAPLFGEGTLFTGGLAVFFIFFIVL